MGFSHYFARRTIRPRKSWRAVRATLRGLDLSFYTAAGVFSRHRIDRGTELLISAADFQPDDHCLDLGCGYGAAGVVAARMCDAGWVTLSDVNPLALELARENIQANHIANASVVSADGLGAFAERSFSLLLCNPPIRAGWVVVFPMIDDAPRVLKANGRAFFVARTRQGGSTVQRRLKAAFGNVEIVKRGSGYKVFRATVSKPEV